MTLEQQLTTLMDWEIESLDKLLAALQQEHRALISADVEAIESATAIKNEALAAQEEVTKSRENFIHRSPFGNTIEGLKQLIDTCKNKEALSASRDHLFLLAQECQASNRSNGRLIMQKQQQTRRALDIIRQTDHSNHTYSGQGKAANSQDTRTLGKA